MRIRRTNKVLTMSVLCVAVLALAVGFAAFSNTLTISSGASVTPNSNTFKVVFSSDSSSLKTDPVAPTPSSLGENGIIDNTTNPTISNLQANFTTPGESVTYTFYVRNEGEYLAYLNSISFRGKTCTAGEGANNIMVNNACSSITTTVSVGNITTSETKTGITSETLNPTDSKEVTVTISYDENGARADGPFTVEFGDITMFYSTVAGENEVVTKTCRLTNDVNGNSEVDLGDEVECAGESFYVVSNDTTAHPTATTGNVTLLTKYNLEVGDINNMGTITNVPNPTGIQSASAKYSSLAFADNSYWGEVEMMTFVYSDKSLLYPYVENYGNYLKNKGVNVKEASLATFDQATKTTNGNDTMYWTGSAYSSGDMFTIEPGGGVSTIPYNYTVYGVRPIVVISVDDIEIS